MTTEVKGNTLRSESVVGSSDMPSSGTLDFRTGIIKKIHDPAGELSQGNRQGRFIIVNRELSESLPQG